MGKTLLPAGARHQLPRAGTQGQGAGRNRQSPAQQCQQRAADAALTAGCCGCSMRLLWSIRPSWRSWRGTACPTTGIAWSSWGKPSCSSRIAWRRGRSSSGRLRSSRRCHDTLQAAHFQTQAGECQGQNGMAWDRRGQGHGPLSAWGSCIPLPAATASRSPSGICEWEPGSLYKSHFVLSHLQGELTLQLGAAKVDTHGAPEGCHQQAGCAGAAGSPLCPQQAAWPRPQCTALQVRTHQRKLQIEMSYMWTTEPDSGQPL